MDVLLKQGLAIPIIVHVTVNGLLTLNGVSVQNLAMEDRKTEPELFNKLLLMGEWIVLENQLNLEIAICMAAQWIASGDHGQIGICAREAVEEVCKEEPGQFLNLNAMEEEDAKEIHWK